VTSLLTADAFVSLVSLSAMEIVLGIDNVVFIAILTARLPGAQQVLARRLGMTMALAIRVGLLFTISWLMSLTRPLFSIALIGQELSGRDLILILGGLFLIFKATWEIYDKLEVDHHEARRASGRAGFALTIVQILLLDIVFSLDSVITAVGMSNQLPVMVTAMVIAMIVMLVSMGAVGGFVERHPSVKILALSFLLLIGVMLVVEGMGQHVAKAYIYFAMAFSLLVELLNMRYRKQRSPGLVLGRRFEGKSA
jgi:predicted tellurium resistance membrane protein TerC